MRDQQESFGVASKLPYHQETIRSSEETRGTLDEGFDQFKQLWRLKLRGIVWINVVHTTMSEVSSGGLAHEMP